MTRPVRRAVKYRKKPVVIEAVQFTGGNHDEVMAHIGCDGHRDDAIAMQACPYVHAKARPRAIFINTLEGQHRADIGDWIIRGVQGELYPCKNEIFLATYEPISEDEDVQGLRKKEGA